MQTFQQARLSRLLYSPDAGDGEGAGGGAPEPEPTPAASGATENTGESAGGDSGKGGADDDSKGVAGLQARVSELSKDKRKLESKLKELETAQATRDEEEAKQRGEWESLAERRGKELDELKPKVAALESERDALKAVLEAQVKAALGTLSERDQKLFPGDALPLAKQFEWVNSAKADTQPAKNGAKGNSPDPAPAGGSASADADTAAKAAYANVINKRF